MCCTITCAWLFLPSALCFVLCQCFIWGRDHVLQDVVEFEFKGDKIYRAVAQHW